ncbi:MULTISPECIES: FxsA family protein [Eikenella]|uniref:FxsA protein n=1 Tax=Eikenella longinqua TaxID=1795827 RepID=A0A1A9RXM5_9NEIS|nr:MULTISPECIES: FxsA family protein [Eikenella]OAM28412.1 hypothetical protein A7P95_05480 [Eikenella longinqua]
MRYLGIWLLLLAGAEAASIVMVAERLGGLPTLLLMILSFMAGLAMLRNLGFSSVMLAGSLFHNQGELSFYQMLWPLRYIVAALLLMSPGFVSTLLACVLMLPIKGGPSAVRPEQMGQGYRASGYRADGDIIDGEFETVRPQEERGETRLLEQHDGEPPRQG